MAIQRMFTSYSDAKPPLYMLMSHANCYRNTRKMQIKGILIHSVGCWGAEVLKRWCQPDDEAPDKDYWLKLLGVNSNKNDWNHLGLKGQPDAGLNAWIGLTADNKMTTLQTMPWDYRPWGCGGSMNSGFIQWENCEPPKGTSAYSREYFEAQYEENVQLCAYLCRKFNLNPTGLTEHNGVQVPVICCHWDSYNIRDKSGARCGSGHIDIYHYWGQFMNNTNQNDPYKSAVMQKFREDVAKAMGKQPEPQPTPTPTPTPSHYPDCPFLIQVKYPVTYYDKPKGKGLGSVQQGTYTIVQVDGDYGKLKSGIGWVYLKDSGIVIKGGDDEMKFTDLKECYYRQGNVMTGDPVRVIQSVVKPIDGVDGSFGPNTKNAVINFQKANGLNPDGIVGAKTWEKIYSKCE